MVTVVFVWLLWSRTQVVREDELLHLHDAWLVGQGALPYRDFFEDHACWYHFLLGQAAAFLKPEADREAAVLFVNFAREFSLLVVLVGLGLLVWIGRLWKEWRLGLMALVLPSGVPFFLETAIETRPDVPTFALWMGALVLLHSVVGGRRPADSGWRRAAGKLPQAVRCSFLWSGIFLGSAVMFTQKMLFALPLLALLAAYGVLEWLRYWSRWLRSPILLGIVFFVVVESLYFTSWKRIDSQVA